MAITDKTIEQLQAAVKTEIMTDASGNEYATRPVHLLPVKTEPQPAQLRVSTLTGLIDYTGQHFKDVDGQVEPTGKFIHVIDHATVQFCGSLYGAAKQRDVFMTAAIESLFGQGFTFDKFYENEWFIIQLQTLFVQTPERDQVLKLLSSIKDSIVTQFDDSGVTQGVTAKAGIALVTEVPVPNPVELQPYRTFRELDQPASKFVLRVRQEQGKKPSCALFESDGGLWKLDAIKGIKQYIETQHLDYPVIA